MKQSGLLQYYNTIVPSSTVRLRASLSQHIDQTTTSSDFKFISSDSKPSTAQSSRRESPQQRRRLTSQDWMQPRVGSLLSVQPASQKEIASGFSVFAANSDNNSNISYQICPKQLETKQLDLNDNSSNPQPLLQHISHHHHSQLLRQPPQTEYLIQTSKSRNAPQSASMHSPSRKLIPNKRLEESKDKLRKTIEINSKQVSDKLIASPTKSRRQEDKQKPRQIVVIPSLRSQSFHSENYHPSKQEQQLQQKSQSEVISAILIESPPFISSIDVHTPHSRVSSHGIQPQADQCDEDIYYEQKTKQITQQPYWTSHSDSKVIHSISQANQNSYLSQAFMSPVKIRSMQKSPRGISDSQNAALETGKILRLHDDEEMHGSEVASTRKIKSLRQINSSSGEFRDTPKDRKGEVLPSSLNGISSSQLPNRLLAKDCPVQAYEAFGRKFRSQTGVFKKDEPVETEAATNTAASVKTVHNTNDVIRKTSKGFLVVRRGGSKVAGSGEIPLNLQKDISTVGQHQYQPQQQQSSTSLSSPTHQKSQPPLVMNFSSLNKRRNSQKSYSRGRILGEGGQSGSTNTLDAERDSCNELYAVPAYLQHLQNVSLPRIAAKITQNSSSLI